MKRRHKIPFLFEVGDLCPDAPIQLGYVQNYFLRRFLYALEKWIYRQADSIVALSPVIQSDIEKKMPGKTIHLIPNMADVDCFRPAPKEARLEKKFELQKKFVVTYAGAVGVANDFVKKIRPFVEDKNRLLEYQEAARRLGETMYSRDRLSAKFANLFVK